MSDQRPRRRPLRYRGIHFSARFLRRWRIVLGVLLLAILAGVGIAKLGGQAIEDGEEIEWQIVIGGGIVYGIAAWIIVVSLWRRRR